MIGEFQEKLIALLESKRVNGYPDIIKPYESEIIEPKKYIDKKSFVGVEVGELNFVSDSTTGQTRQISLNVEVVMIVRQMAGNAAKRSSGADLLDWFLAAIKGERIGMEDGDVIFINMRGSVRTIPDLLHPYWAAVATINPEIYE